MSKDARDKVKTEGTFWEMWNLAEDGDKIKHYGSTITKKYRVVSLVVNFLNSCLISDHILNLSIFLSLYFTLNGTIVKNRIYLN